ncbi:11905_t:CDS:2 [Ambispora gerdemannii]|uniref:11905_t:CDS:1 n=1 Tax=Ambispora gerdemannii TaxID=144530 RepID=A0A9N9FJE1_9GLOM|nr:11905_t:CDS:2 [Ambispora gerdemannii]
MAVSRKDALSCQAKKYDMVGKGLFAAVNSNELIAAVNSNELIAAVNSNELIAAIRLSSPLTLRSLQQSKPTSENSLRVYYLKIEEQVIEYIRTNEWTRWSRKFLRTRDHETSGRAPPTWNLNAINLRAYFLSSLDVMDITTTATVVWLNSWWSICVGDVNKSTEFSLCRFADPALRY